MQQSTTEYEYDPAEDLHHPYEDGIDSAEEDGPMVVRRSIGYNRSSSSPPSADNRQKYAKHGGLPSGRSPGRGGPDGYDAFENTNNKKKRKIPTSGSLGSHSGLTTDLANLGISGGGGHATALDDGSGTGSYYGSGNPASPGGSVRGRYPRGSVRTPNGRVQMPPNSWPGSNSSAANSVGKFSMSAFSVTMLMKNRGFT